MRLPRNGRDQIGLIAFAALVVVGLVAAAIYADQLGNSGSSPSAAPVTTTLPPNVDATSTTALPPTATTTTPPFTPSTTLFAASDGTFQVSFPGVASPEEYVNQRFWTGGSIETGKTASSHVGTEYFTLTWVSLPAGAPSDPTDLYARVCAERFSTPAAAAIEVKTARVIAAHLGANCEATTSSAWLDEAVVLIGARVYVFSGFASTDRARPAFDAMLTSFVPSTTPVTTTTTTTTIPAALGPDPYTAPDHTFSVTFPAQILATQTGASRLTARSPMVAYRGVDSVSANRVYVVRSFTLDLGTQTAGQFYAGRCSELKHEGGTILAQGASIVGGRAGFACRYLSGSYHHDEVEAMLIVGTHLYILSTDTLTNADEPLTQFYAFVASFHVPAIGGSG